ncbi:MAG: 16S rRNA (uracil(1498)-N(3))-methyltransferase [Elusimicrobia bacterium]|nr:16S rRNA (uracil(1498)-N(3))-methyltransferase [Elusimicrobiota bacterium]
MPQFYVPAKNVAGKKFSFDPSESHHLAKVLRKKPGDTIQIFDGQGATLTAQITDTSNPNQVKGEIITSKQAAVADKISLILYPALIKSARFEWMLEKATELGVCEIQPILTERTIITWDRKKADSKLKRWQTIALSSAKQCGRPHVPVIHAPLPYLEAIKSCRDNNDKLILWEGESEKQLSSAWKEKNQVNTIRLLIGPEGGFTIHEFNAAKANGFTPVRLGENILRAETAVIAASSLILFS